MPRGHRRSTRIRRPSDFSAASYARLRVSRVINETPGSACVLVFGYLTPGRSTPQNPLYVAVEVSSLRLRDAYPEHVQSAGMGRVYVPKLPGEAGSEASTFHTLGRSHGVVVCAGSS